MKLLLVVVYIITSISYACLMSSYRFTCVDPCQHSFPEPRNLARHQRVCLSWQNHLTSRAEKRRLLVTSQTTVEDGLPTKRQKLGPSSPPDGNPARVSSNVLLSSMQGLDQDDHQSTEEANSAIRLCGNESGPGDSAPSSAAPSGLGCVGSSSTPIHGTTLPPHSRQLPARYREQLPEPPPPLPPPEPRLTLPRVILHIYDKVQSNFNKFGVARLYRYCPSYDPDSLLTADQLSNIVNHPTRASDASGDHSNPERPSLPTRFALKLPPWPWKNMSVWRLMSWGMSRSHEKSHSKLTHLVNNILKVDDFCINNLPDNFNASREYQKLDHAMHEESQGIFSGDGWRESSVRISVLTGIKDTGNRARLFNVPNLFYHSITSVIHAAFSELTAKLFHLTLFKRIWRSPTSGREQRIYDELYCSDAWNDEHDKLQKEK